MKHDKMYKKCIEEYKDFPIEGVNYLDLNPLYKKTTWRNLLVDECVDKCKDLNFDYIGMIESRGFIIGSMIAQDLDKGVLLLRSKPNRLPGDTVKVEHTLEYGTSQMEVQKGEGRVLIFDDVLATGGTARGAIDVLLKGGYEPISAMFVAELDFLNPELPIPHNSIIHYDN